MTSNLILLVTLGLLAIPVAEATDDLKPWPPAEPGYERMVFRLQSMGNENDHKVEILIGKELEVDCNRHHFGGQLERHTVKGWGYSYFLLRYTGGLASTMMACPPEASLHQEFVMVRGEGFLQRYNSKLPVVVYVPQGFEVRYRVWSAGTVIHKALEE